jgi:hypothetical protein
MAKLDADGWAKRTAENALKPSTTNGFVNLMEGGDVIKPFEHGWIMIDQVNASALIMMKNEK